MFFQLPFLGIGSNQPELLKTFSNSQHPHPKIVCHRGAKTFAPENTLSAIDLAIGLGFNIVEIDVRQTKDGVPVVLHDSSANRTTNGRGAIKKMNYADVCKLDAGSWFDPLFCWRTSSPIGRCFSSCERVLRGVHRNQRSRA